MTVVYWTGWKLLNLAVDYLLLLATARLAGLPCGGGRLGAVRGPGGRRMRRRCSCPGAGGLAHPLCRLAAGTAMCRLAWRRKDVPGG